jgi:serine/threonine protein kinase/WD40 repeat protein
MGSEPLARTIRSGPSAPGHRQAVRARTALADLAFGSLSPADPSLAGNLAVLPIDALQLDLTDPAQRHFGNYELLELIGEGGMGVVYRARQINLDREVAIKLLSAGPWASREFVDRFLREAQHAARMQHPNIVTVHEVGMAEELHYFSMRLVRGESMAAWLQRRGPVGARRAAQLMRLVADAVAYAHSLQVLHLDLKPANVLLDENETPLVADFGLARQFTAMQAIANTELSGTPSYMAPEQAEVGNQPLTTATDVWGLGAILYELVTGQPPFRGESVQATLSMLGSGRVRRPRRLQPGLPLDLEAIILKCLAREPAQRYASVRDLAEDLARFHELRAVRARPLNVFQRTQRWARREPRLAASAVLAISLLVIGLVTTSQQWQRAEHNASVSNERLWESRRNAAMRLQADGMGFEALPDLLANIGEQEQAPGSELAMIERREVGAILNRGVTLIDRMAIADARPLAAQLSPDGSILALALDDVSVRWFDTRNLVELGRIDLASLPTSDGALRAPRLLRFVDNDRLRVTLDWIDYLLSPSEGDTYLVDLKRARLIEPPAAFGNLADSIFSADGRHALLRNQQGLVQLWQVEPWKSIRPAFVDTNIFTGFSWLLGRGGRFAWRLPEGAASLSIRDLTASAEPDEVEVKLPARTELTAWTENQSGTQLAIGDSTGHVFIYDIAGSSLRPLATPFGTRIRWLAYSEDDAWLAAVREDGAAFAFDAASGSSLNAGLMQHDFVPHQVVISHRQRLLVVSGEGQTALWHLPEPGPSGLEATRLLAQPTRSGRAGTNSVGISLQAGLLVTANMDGEVRLWRVPLSPIRPESAGLQISGRLRFDGEHLVDVAWTRVRIVSLKDKQATPWIDMPQPVGFAELVNHSRQLVVTSGAELHVFDAKTLRPKQPPIPLPGNPLRLVASPDGRRLVMAFAGNGPRGFEERLQSYELGAASGSPASIVVRGPLRQLEISDDGSRLLLTGPADDATTVLDSASLRRLGSYRHHADSPVLWASFDHAGSDSRIWLLERELDEFRANNAELVAWDALRGKVLEEHRVPGAFPIGLTAVAGRPILAARSQALLDPATGDAQATPLNYRAETTSVFAISHDASLIAHVRGRDVQLNDARSLLPIGPPLHSNLGAYDFPAQLAFSPDDHWLLGRALISGRWLLWNVSADSRPLQSIRRDADLLGPNSDGVRILQMPDAAQHERLRHSDPGAWPPAESRPAISSARIIAGKPVPARPAATSPLMLDLTGQYTVAPMSVQDINGTVFPVLSQLPFGQARLDGTEFDIRGAFELRWGNPDKPRALNLPATKANGIRTPAVAIAAFHVLLYSTLNEPEPAERDYAGLRLHYEDGSTAFLPIRTNRDVLGIDDPARPPPFAWVRGDQMRLLGVRRQSMLSNPRLPNPHPERLIRSLDVETLRDSWAEPVIFAITAEPVIQAAESRSGSEKDASP